MKENTLTISIKKPVHEVLLWLLDPKNTPLWVSGVVHEERNEEPTKLGTIYRNRGKNGKWNEYEITEFEEDKLFTFSLRDGNYACRYTFESPLLDQTKLTYFEWVKKGEIEEPFTMKNLEKLKSVIES
jgi:hypothetical protein